MIIMSWTQDYDEGWEWERAPQGHSVLGEQAVLSNSYTRKRGQSAGGTRWNRVTFPCRFLKRAKAIVSTSSRQPTVLIWRWNLKPRSLYLEARLIITMYHRIVSPLWTSPILDLKYLSVFPKTSTLSSTILPIQLKWLNTGTTLCNLQGSSRKC